MMKINLNKTDTRAPEKFSKEDTKVKLQKLKFRMEELQNLMYAEGRHALLVILQGMDASGKDGAIKNVFESVNPMGCRVTAFKTPTPAEMKHDFLWRIHQQVPEKGMIGIFNRSHYEDVLIQRVHKWVTEKIIRQRYEQINAFEKLLRQTGTTVLKFYLHVSREEQRERLKERVMNPSKMWKHNSSDAKEQGFYKEYRKAYHDAIENCSESVEWTIVPSDQNWYKEFLIAKTIVDALESLKMKYPELPREEVKASLTEIRKGRESDSKKQ
jgi:PPK2 family polyphosphate:nucleotide phosphotransferase